MRKVGNIDREWTTPDNPNFRWEHVQVEILMDIRRELHDLNRLLNCPNFTAIPTTLRSINKKLAAKVKP